MSRIKVQQPLIHTPSFKEYYISGRELARKYLDTGVKLPFPRSDNWYYFTDEDGWTSIIIHLLIKSSLYREEKFDCEDYALKAQVTCAELYGLNTLRYTYGSSPLGQHGFNTFWTGDDFFLFEPNAGFQFESPYFEWGEYGYLPKYVLL